MMKTKLIRATIVAMLCVGFTSCYNTKITVGEILPNTPLQKVNTKWNNHFLFGLIPGNSASLNASEYNGGNQSYVIKTNQPFIHQLIGCLTFGIYTPSETSFYVPIDWTPRTYSGLTKIAYVKNGYIAYENEGQKQYLDSCVITDAEYMKKLINSGYQYDLSKKAFNQLYISGANKSEARIGVIDMIIGKYGNVIHAQLALKEDVASATNAAIIGRLIQDIYQTIFLPLDSKYSETQKVRVTLPLTNPNKTKY